MRFSGSVMKYETTEEKVQKRNAYLKALEERKQAIIMMRQAQLAAAKQAEEAAKPAKKAYKFVLL